MALSVKIDEVWSDLDHRFIPDSLGVLKKVINTDAVLTSIDNILRTNRGERVMLPEFGSGLRSLVFENMDEAAFNFISQEIRENIEIWDDRISVQEVSVSMDPDQQIVSMSLEFSIKGNPGIFLYSIPLPAQGV